MPSVNFRDVKPLEGFEVLPPGVYEVEITNAKIEPAKSNPQNELLKIEYTVVQDAEHGAGRKIFENMSFTESAYEFTSRKIMSLLLACGYEEEAIRELEEIDDDLCADIIGYTLALNVGVTEQTSGEYKGKKQNRVNSYAALASA